MSKAAELAALIGSQTALSNRNLIINGAMQVAQRGTQVTGSTGDGYKTVDRFNVSNSSLGTWTFDQDTNAPNGFSNSFKVTCTTADASPAASDKLLIMQRIEAQNLQLLGYGTSGAQSITLSFYVKSNKTGNASVNLLQHDNSNKLVGFQYSISSANTWERKIITFPADTSGVINNDNGYGFQLEWFLNSGSNFTGGSHRSTWTAFDNTDRNVSNLGIGGAVSDYFQITGVQLELGEQDTAFEHRSFGDEYQRCLRYYYRTPAPNGGLAANEPFPCVGNMDGSTTGAYMLQFPIPMRAAPSAIEQSGTASDYSIRVTSDANGTSVPTASGFTAESALINLVSSGAGFTSGDACFMRAESTDAFLAFSAEL
jgi:hypothetical protein